MIQMPGFSNADTYTAYHISSLLQVSDIAKHERDHTTSGDLLERALFSFGRAVHPTFAKKIAEGKARLNFHRPENREFFLAAYRYILNIGMRATWRTAYEWAKLVLSLDDDDPFEMKLVIDQLAIRARQYQSLLDIANCQYLEKWWIWWPNICFSKALAIKALSTDGGEEAKQALIKTIESYPWVAANLLQVLDVAKIPPAVWGSSPFRELPAGHLHSEIYITQGLDLWKTTEAKEFLISAASVAEKKTPKVQTWPHRGQISLNEARYVVLSEKPALISLLPKRVDGRYRLEF